MNETQNLIIVLLLSAIVMISWQYFYENPRMERLQKLARERNLTNQTNTSNLIQEEANFKDREEALSESPRVTIENNNIKGSISLKGAKLDDVFLLNYKEDLDNNSKNVKLLSPSKSREAYFAEFGWLSIGSNTIDLPGSDTIWRSDSDILKPGSPLNLSWKNSQGINFVLKFELDENYMIRISQRIENHSSNPLRLKSYGRINRIYHDEEKSFAILHEGVIGAFNGILREIRYKNLKNDSSQKFVDIKSNSWLGITDKYWLTSIIPRDISFDCNFIYSKTSSQPRYQADFLSKEYIISSGEKSQIDSLLFIGPKKLELLDKYSSMYNIALFDRAVDFGWFYFLTKPMFYALQLLYNISGNFGIAILLLTVFVKLLMFPLANKSYKSMNRMKILQPKVNYLKTLYGDDKLKFNQEIMALYKKEQINPLSGCLPLFVQIPVFFSLYKVLFVTIEMRHAKFFGWIKDLSAPDPTSMLNLFGLLPWSSPAFLSIGVWPLVMGVTMYIQQKLSPEPADPLQAKFMKLLPLLFTVMFYTFPAGLIIYWAWNNSLSILQQWYLTKNIKQNGKKV